MQDARLYRNGLIKLSLYMLIIAAVSGALSVWLWSLKLVNILVFFVLMVNLLHSSINRDADEAKVTYFFFVLWYSTIVYVKAYFNGDYSSATGSICFLLMYGVLIVCLVQWLIRESDVVRVFNPFLEPVARPAHYLINRLLRLRPDRCDPVDLVYDCIIKEKH